MRRLGGLVALCAWATAAQADVVEDGCENYASAAMVTAVGRDAGVSMEAAMRAAVEAGGHFAEVMIGLIETVYETGMEPHHAYAAVMTVCMEDGGW